MVGPHAPRRDALVFAVRPSPRRSGETPVRIGAFDHRYELHEGDAYVAQEPVDFQRASRIVAVDDLQNIEFGVMGAQKLKCSYDRGRARPAAPVAAMAVVEDGRAVDARADEEVVAAQEARPFFHEQRVVGLDRVPDPLSRRAVFLRQRQSPPRMRPGWSRSGLPDTAAQEGPQLLCRDRFAVNGTEPAHSQ